jgi:hypothetical protein
MQKREYIDQFVKLLTNKFKKFKKDNEFVGPDFFDSNELKEIVLEASAAIFEYHDMQLLTGDVLHEAYNIAIKEAKHKNQSGMKVSLDIVSPDNSKRHWLTAERKEKIGWDNGELKNYRDRYLEYLSTLGRSDDYINETKRSSLNIVKKFGDPERKDGFITLGMVVGSVQSGKTANFNAVINSAIDVGYGLVIVLSGIMEDLRRQTQRRIEKDVEGKFEKGAHIGVGAVSSFGLQGLHEDIQQIVIPTSTETDFKKTIREAEFSLSNRNVLVCKKNTSVLKNLLIWLKNNTHADREKIKTPLIIIDDEADNASLNNLGEKGIEYASKINGHIRALLELFDKRTYLGYTATPFANVLQDRNESPAEMWEIKDGETLHKFPLSESLFPKDFIELLFPPPNYIGAKHFFETIGEDVKKIDPLVAPVVDDHVNHFPRRIDKVTNEPTNESGRGTRAANKYDDYPKSLPPSLEDAVKCFLLATSIRLSRRSVMYESKLYQPHNTMLIHVSRFITWQSKTKDLVQNLVDELERRLSNENPNTPGGIYDDMQRIWNKYYEHVVSDIRTYLPDEYEDEFLIPKKFDDIKGYLITAIKSIDVKAINSNPPKDKLDYPDETEKTYIAIGGNRLSRGFTLEGLTVNYFVRDTNFADTLLQMGRWFGYRPGYLDCCKLFTTTDAIQKFDQTSLIIEDLEQKFIDMNKDPSSTPEKYALRVMTHPGVLKVTRNSILKNAKEVKFSYSDHLVQTKKFHMEKNVINDAWEDFKGYIASVSSKLEKVYRNNQLEYLVYNDVSAEDLFKLFELRRSFLSEDIDDLQRYIEVCQKNGKLNDWSVAIKCSGQGSSIDLDLSGDLIKVDTTVRSGPNITVDSIFAQFRDDAIFQAGGKSANIFSGGKDFQIRLNKSQIKDAETEFKENKFEELSKKYSNETESLIRRRVENINIPEKVYRRKMSSQEGVLVIYLLDTDKAFKNTKGQDINELSPIKDELDVTIPLVGYAFGIPPVGSSDLGNFLISKQYDSQFFDDDDEFNDVIEDADDD